MEPESGVVLELGSRDREERESLRITSHQVTVGSGAHIENVRVTSLGERLRSNLGSWDVATNGMISKGATEGETWYALPTYGRGLWKPFRGVDEYGVVFRALNKKGVGMVDGDEVVGEPSREDMWIRGLATLGDVQKDSNRCEYWLARSKGKLRVRRYLCEAEVKGVPVAGVATSVDELCEKYDRKKRKAGLGLAVVRNPYTVGDALIILSDGRGDVVDTFVDAQLEYLRDDSLCSPRELADIERRVSNKSLAAVYGRIAGQQAGVMTTIGLLQENANLQNLTMAFEAKDLADHTNERPLSVGGSSRDFAVQVVDYFVAAARVVAALNIASGRELDDGFAEMTNQFFVQMTKELSFVNRFRISRALRGVFDRVVLMKDDDGLGEVADDGYWDKKGMANRISGRMQGQFVDHKVETEFRKKIENAFRNSGLRLF